jgi:thiamine-phosphate pyrophosphorylase
VSDHFQLCYITDRRALDPSPLLPVVLTAICAGLDFIQIREKDLPARALIEIAGPAVADASGTKTRIVVNGRLDVALAVGAAGVHLGTQSLPARAVREHVPRSFLVGVSCHSLNEAMDAEAAGADYALLGPIFETPSKLPYGPPLDLTKLAEVTARVKLPVLALGGITIGRVKACVEAGASGIAGISIFQNAPSLAERVEQIRAEWSEA